MNEESCRETLCSIDPNFKAQYVIPDTNFVADFFLPSKNLVIEVNGPLHYIKKIKDGQVVVTEEPNGRVKAKMQRVKDLGFKYLLINFNFFNHKKSVADFEKELRDLIEKA
jgi:very-short-patch-repair endonuclease